MYAEIFEYLKTHNGEVSYSDLIKWVQCWYGVEKKDAEYYLDKLLMDYDQVFQFLPMRNEGRRRFPRLVRLVE